MAIHINIGDKPGISCCLISCAALAQNTSPGMLWLSWTSVPLDRKTNFDWKHLQEVPWICCFAGTTWEIMLQQINAEALQYGVLETWALFVILLLFFFLCRWPSYSISYGRGYLCPFFGLSDQELFLNYLLWAGNVL